MKSLKILFTLLSLISIGFVSAQDYAKLGQNLGGAQGSHTIDISGDGKTVVIGDSESDEVKVFNWENYAWVQKGLTLTDENTGFGSSVAISEDGNTIVIGAKRKTNGVFQGGMVQAYSWTGSSWQTKGAGIFGTIEGQQIGHSVDISSNGNHIIFGSIAHTNFGIPNIGLVKVYEFNGSWNQKGNVLEGTQQAEAFGYSVSISDNGNTIAVGSPLFDGVFQNFGKVSVYSFGTGWTQKGVDLFGTGADTNYGRDVALSGDGNTLFASAPNNSNQAGTPGYAVVSNFSGGNWVTDRTFTGSQNGELFGWGIDLSTNAKNLVIGSPGFGGNTGRGLVYTKESGTWEQVKSDIAGIGSEMGYSVAISNDTTLVAFSGENYSHVSFLCLIEEPESFNAQFVCQSYTLPNINAGGFYSATNGGGSQFSVGQEITESSSIYTYNANELCRYNGSFAVIVGQPFEPDNPGDIIACESYSLPTPAIFTSYYTGPSATGSQLTIGDEITEDDLIYVYNFNGCINESSFNITINDPISIEAPSDTVVCGEHILPTFEAGDYYSESNGQGTLLNDGAVISSSQTVHVYKQDDDGACKANDNFEVTVNPNVTVSEIQNQEACGFYVLPNINTGQFYSASQGEGLELNIGDTIFSDSTIYVFDATALGCSDENSFDISVTTSPDVTISLEGDSLVTASGADTYQWKDCLFLNQEIAGATSNKFKPTRDGEYSVTVTNGVCEVTSECYEVSNKWATVAAGSDHVIALKENGTLWSWGNNGFGQLGNGTTDEALEPQQIGTDSDWMMADAHDGHGVALKQDSTLWVWGDNFFGQFGNGTKTESLVPIQIGTDKWKFAISGPALTIAIKSDGTLWAWGANFFGQLGVDNSTSEILTPSQIGVDNDWKEVSVANAHVLALKNDNTLWSWGQNFSGELGDGTNQDRSTPQQIGADEWISISAGGATSLGVKSDGTLWLWGLDFTSGTGATYNTPTQIGTDTDWKTALSAMGSFAFAIKTNDILYGWGSNFAGELGDGTQIVHTEPTQINDDEWVAIDAGMFYSIGIKSDRLAYCSTGENMDGQLGTGSKDNLLAFSCQVDCEQISYDIIEFNGLLVASQQEASYLWLDCDNNDIPIIGATEATFQPQSSGNYSLLTTFGSCSDTSNCYFYSITNSNEVSLDESLKLYPNPNSGSFIIQSGVQDIEMVVVYDGYGKIVSTLNPNSNHVDVILPNAAPGIYFVNIKQKNKVLKRKVIITQ